MRFIQFNFRFLFILQLLEEIIAPVAPEGTQSRESLLRS